MSSMADRVVAALGEEVQGRIHDAPARLERPRLPATHDYFFCCATNSAAPEMNPATLAALPETMSANHPGT